MVPVKQSIQLNFAKGLDTKTDPWQTSPQNFLELENMVFTTGNELKKRNGFSQFPTTVVNPLSVINLSTIPANIATGRFVASYNNELVLGDGLNLYSYSDSNSSWIYKGRATLASLAQTNINKDVNNNTQQDSAQNSTLGLNLFAWVNDINSGNPGLYYNLIDQVSGQVVQPATFISTTGIKPRCFSSGSKLYLLYYDTTGPSFNGLIISGIDSTVAVISVVTDMATDFPNYDADVYNGSIYLAYYTNHGSPKETKISLLNASLAVTATITKNLLTNQCISIFDDPSGNIWVICANNAGGAGGGVFVFIVNSTVTATVLAPTAVDTSSLANDAYNVTGCYSSITNQGYIFYDQTILPEQSSTVTMTGISVIGTNVAFTQPSASGGTIAIPVYQPNWNPSFVGTNIFIPGTAGVAGNYYEVNSGAVGWLFTISAPSVAPVIGAVYTDASSNSYTVARTVISSGTTMLVTGAGPPPSSGTLTKSSGTGDSSITFSASTTVEVVVIQNNGDSRNQSAGSSVPAVQASAGAGFVFSIYSTTNYSWINFNTMTAAGVAGTSSLYANSANLASKAWAYLGVPTVGIVHAATLQPTYFISNLYNYLNVPVSNLNANLAVKICESEAGGTPAQNILPRVNQVNSTAFQIAFLQQDLLFTSTSVAGIGPNGFIAKANTYSNFGVVSDVIDFSQSNPSTAVLGNNLHIATGVLLMYDGQNVVEHNFHIYPEGVTFSVSTPVPASPLLAGQYGYQFIYEWTDNQGQVHKSSPSPVISVPVNGGGISAGQAITFNVPFLTLTQKYASTLVAYRTQANGSIYFRLLPVPKTEPNVLSANPPVWTFLDETPDSALTANEQIYTTGEVENIGAPSCFALFAYKNRLILIPSDNPNSYWFSKQVDPGSPVEFSDLFVENVGTVYGPLTGGARLDDKFILSTETNLLYVVGDGPAASGANNDFSDPIFITSDAGVVNQQSFVYSPVGLFFKSQKGIYLCGRDLSVSYHGAPVEGFNGQSVVGGQLIPTTNQVRFLLSGSSSLMYDYFYGQWGQFSNPSGVGDCIYNSLHTYVTASGLVFTETPGVYLDGTSPVLMSFLTSWFKLSGLQGYQRSYFFFLLANYLSAHNLSVSTYTNFSLTPDQTDIIVPNPASALENWRIFVKNQRCQSFQISLNEIYTGTPGPGFTMSGVNLILGAKNNFRTFPAAQSVG